MGCNKIVIQDATVTQQPVIQVQTEEPRVDNEKQETPITTMSEQAKIIFTYLMYNYKSGTDELRERTIARTKLLRDYNGVNPFTNEYAIFYDLCVNMPKINFTDMFVIVYLQQNNAQIRNKANIDFKAYSIGDSDTYNVFVESCVSILREIQQEPIDETTYLTALEMYKMLYLSEKALTILETSVQILTDGYTVRGRKYAGYSGMRDYCTTEMLHLDNIVQQRQTRGAVCYGVTPKEDEEQNKNMPLGTLGIPGVDDYYTCFEGDMVNLMGAAKAGKSRLCVQVLEHMLVDNHQNCLIWSLENGFDGWERMFRVKFFNRVYNKTVGSVVQKKILTEKMLKSGIMPTEIRELEEASWEQFQYSAEYGKLVNVEEPLCYDTFLEVLDTYVKKYNVKFICIDYLGLMERGNGAKHLETNALVADVYKKVLQYLKTHKIAGIFPTHLKQECTDHFGAMSNAELENADLRTAAGLSYEIVKTPDVNMALIATKADIANCYSRLAYVPSRVEPFPLTELQTDLGSSTFVKHN